MPVRQWRYLERTAIWSLSDLRILSSFMIASPRPRSWSRSHLRKHLFTGHLFCNWTITGHFSWSASVESMLEAHPGLCQCAAPTKFAHGERYYRQHLVKGLLALYSTVLGMELSLRTASLHIGSTSRVARAYSSRSRA
jgi:hypothetical protein